MQSIRSSAAVQGNLEAVESKSQTLAPTFEQTARSEESRGATSTELRYDSPARSARNSDLDSLDHRSQKDCEQLQQDHTSEPSTPTTQLSSESSLSAESRSLFPQRPRDNSQNELTDFVCPHCSSECHVDSAHMWRSVNLASLCVKTI